MKIEIFSRKFISPSHPTPSQLRSYELSCIDQLSAPAYATFVFFYPAPPNDAQSRLEKSLSEILTLYYPFAGRYNEKLHEIHCCDEGAEFLVANVDCKLDHFLQKKPDTKVLNQFVPYPKEIPLTTTILAIQVNRFQCNGLAIGFSLSHKLVDGVSYILFVNQWATLCRDVTISRVKTPKFNLQTILPARDVHKKEIMIPIDPATNFVTHRFTFYNEAISNFKLLSKLHPSRVEILAALTWKARIALNQAKFGHLRTSLLIFLMNLRGKTSLDIPNNVVGNCVHLVVAKFNPAEMKLSFNDLLSLIRTAKTNAEEFAAKSDGESILSSRIGTMKVIEDELRQGKTDISVLTSLCCLPYYEADFGWGEPIWVSSVHKPTEIIHLMDNKSRTGIEAYISMEEYDMVQFQKDEDILALNSIISKL
ncbi:hypothetical protein ACFE04_002829 [Oxalis oulophora]